MKIEASFLPVRNDWARQFALLLWGVVLAILVCTTLLASNVLMLRAEQPELAARLVQLTEQMKTDKPAMSLPPVAELSSVRERVRELNALGSSRGWPISTLLARIERWLPDRVYLVSLQQRRRSGEIQLVAESTSAEALTAFLLKLEKEIHFTEVLLVRQGRRHGPGDAIQFEVRMRERL